MYELLYSPLVAGVSYGSVAFLNPVAGEFWYELKLVAEAAVHGTSDDSGEESDPELQAAINAVRKAMGPSKDRVPVPRLVGRLARRGFRLDTIRAALRHSGLPDPSSLEPETDR